MKPEGLAVIGIGLIVVLIGLSSPLSRATTLSIVGASLSVSPSSGPAGTLISATPSGFIGSVSITFNGAPVCSTNSGYACNFSAPNLAAGTYPVGASDTNGNSASTSFTITSATTTTTSSTTTSSSSPGVTGYITSAASPTSGMVPLTVSWSAQGGGHSPWAYNVAFGDGSTYSLTTTTSIQGTHTYSNAGTYTLSISSTDSTGASATNYYTISVSAPPSLSISGSASPVSGTVPLSVSFSVTASGGSSPYSYLWSFGDGGTSSSASASHTYSTAGSYTASITVTDSASHTQSSSFTITASNPVIVTTTSTTSSQTVITTTSTSTITTTNAQGQTITTTSTSVATITTSTAVPVLVTTTQSQTQGQAIFSTQQSTVPNITVIVVGMVVVVAGAFLTRRGRQ